jgi:hypothetical protein
MAVSRIGVRVGGIVGVVAAAAAVPAYIVGSPEHASARSGVRDYFAATTTFLDLNAVLPAVHLLGVLGFLAVLVAVLRRAAGPSIASYLALAGGVVFVALTAAGLASEVAVPAATQQFQSATISIGSAQAFLALATWLYHYSQLGAALLIFATAFVVWRTRVFPPAAVALAVLGILPLVHIWVGVLGAYSTLLWLAIMGVLMIVAPPKESDVELSPRPAAA